MSDPWNKGLVQSQEHIQKQVETRKRNGNYAHSEETKMKLSVANKGKKLSIEQRRKMSEAAKGRIISEEHKESLRKFHTGKIVSEETRTKISEIQKGRKLSEETRQKMSASHKKLWANPQYAKDRFEAYAVKPTKPELQMEALLNILFPGPGDYKYVGDGNIWINGKNPDFININGQKKIIEVFGDYWHKDSEPPERIKVFEPYGYQSLIIWESDLNEDINYVEKRLKAFHVLEHK